jgi:hypothetical protein
MPLLPPVVVFPDAGWMKQHVAEARDIYGTGSFAEILAFRIREIPAILPLHVFVFPRTVALFLFGAFTWRTGVLRHAPAHKRPLFSVAAAGIVTGAGLALAAEHQVLAGLVPAWGRRRACHRDCCLCRASDVQRLVAGALLVRPGRMAVAQVDVWYASAHACGAQGKLKFLHALMT